MEPSTILIALLCLALLVYLPKLRNTVFWIFFPFVMVFVRFPRTRKPGLVIGVLGLAVGSTWYGVNRYRERHYWYCDVWSFKNHQPMPGRTSEKSLTCFRGLDACRTSHAHAPSDAELGLGDEWGMIYDGDWCSHSYRSIWSYDLNTVLPGDATHPDLKVTGAEQFTSKDECEQARAADAKEAQTPCHLAEKSAK